MKRFFCIMLMLYMLFLTWALADSIPSGSANSLSDWTFPDFPEMSTDSWLSEMTPPEEWSDLIPDDFGSFPENWGNFESMENWSARFDNFKKQISGEKENGESSFPDMSDPMIDLQDAFGNIQNKESSELGQSSEIRDLFAQAFGSETADQELIMLEIPVSRKDLEDATGLSGSILTGSSQMSSIAKILDVPLTADAAQSKSDISSLPDFTSTSSQNLNSLFSAQSGKLQTSMDVTSDRYRSLYSLEKANQEISSQETRKSLYSLTD